MKPRRNKFGAKPTVIDGIRFASKRESARYSELKLLERAGRISDLELQPKFPIVVNGIKVCTYIADFAYTAERARVIEDVKSPATAVNRIYRLKRKLVHALYSGVHINEVM